MRNKKLSFVTILIMLAITLFVACTSNNKKKTVKTDSLSTTLQQPTNDSFKVRPLTNIKFEPTEQRLARGEYLANGILACFTCHSPRDWNAPGAPPIEDKKGSGGTILQQDSANLIIAPNISPDKETGAGTWTDDMLSRAIREGVGHDGRALNLNMQYFFYRTLSDEDLASVIVYLRSLPPVHHVVPPTKMVASDRSNIEKNLKPLTQPVPAPDLSSPEKRGWYLVSLGECVGCHSAGTDYMPGLFGGGNLAHRFGRASFTANITPDASGISYGETHFVFVMRTGKGGTLNPIMPWIAFKNINDEDLKAIWAYLCTLPPANHYVNNLQPFTHCAICGQLHGLGGKNKRMKPAGIKIDLHLYSQYTGTYLNNTGQGFASTYIIFKEKNKLFGKTWDKGLKAELIPQSDLRFLAPGWPMPIDFIKDENGRITQLKEETNYGVMYEKEDKH